MTPLEMVLAKLPDARRSGDSWSARCPAHDDTRASLSVSEGDDGRVLFHCHAGCTVDATVGAIGLTVPDLFPAKANGVATDARQPAMRTNSATFEYVDEHGVLLFQTVRYEPKRFVQRRPNGKGGWLWNLHGVRRVLYRMPDLAGAIRIYVGEGEQVVDAARLIGLIATTSVGGAKAPNKTDWRSLAGKDVVIFPDNDDAGADYAQTVAGILTHLSPPATVRIVELPGLPEHGDIVEYIATRRAVGLSDDAIRAEIEQLAETTPVVASNSTGGSAPIIVRIADVKPEPVQWLWPGRIALGKLTLVAGDPGLGKSFLTLDIAARLSSGTPWPDRREDRNPVGGVVLLSAEDDIADTIRPRLDAAGAAVSRIAAIEGVEFSDLATGKCSRRSFNLEKDIPALEAAIRQTPDCRLVVVDPVTAYLGKSDSHKNAEIRGLLAPLSELAGRYKVAIVCVTHLNKSGGPFALYRAMGSLAFVAAARAVWLVVRDEENPSRRLFLSAKNNIARDGTGLAYSLEPTVGDPTVAVVAWEAEPVTITANEALTVDQPRHDKPSERDTATDWLHELLADGPLPTTEIKSQASEAGFAWATLRRAKERLGIRPRKSGFDGGWVWALPTGPASEDAHEGAKMLTPLNVSTFGQGEHFRRNDAAVGTLCTPDSVDGVAEWTG